MKTPEEIYWAADGVACEDKTHGSMIPAWGIRFKLDCSECIIEMIREGQREALEETVSLYRERPILTYDEIRERFMNRYDALGGCTPATKRKGDE